MTVREKAGITLGVRLTVQWARLVEPYNGHEAEGRHPAPRPKNSQSTGGRSEVSMDLQPKPDGHLHFKLGPVEKWLIAAGAAIVIGTPVMLYRDMKSESKAQRYILDRLVTESAVTNSRLDTMNAMLSDVPSLRRDVAELKVRVDRQEEEVRDLRARVR